MSEVKIEKCGMCDMITEETLDKYLQEGWKLRCIDTYPGNVVYKGHKNYIFYWVGIPPQVASQG